ncbi:hypothetical protein PALI_a2367 [Pseudoalteromonas aliena SW19]|uniref:Uncharacterized protein n=1 Tax=Pseudoalteromonas aliena SW19 TaxID=1314866 RepID=A0ABR9E1A2_9GAMM|nr:hypothetical protein [Pseudoalteromonas aliena SW19]
MDDKIRFYLLTIYSKNEVTDLTADQKKQLKEFLEVWRNEQTRFVFRINYSPC